MFPLLEEAGARMLLRRKICSLRGTLAHFFQDGQSLRPTWHNLTLKSLDSLWAWSVFNVLRQRQRERFGFGTAPVFCRHLLFAKLLQPPSHLQDVIKTFQTVFALDSIISLLQPTCLGSCKRRQSFRTTSPASCTARPWCQVAVLCVSVCLKTCIARPCDTRVAPWLKLRAQTITEKRIRPKDCKREN